MAELIEQLDSNNKDVAEAAKQKLSELFSSVKDPWLVSGLYEYFLRTKSVKVMDLLINVPDHHHPYLFDRLNDSVRSQKMEMKIQALTLLGHIVRSQPTWLYNIKDHQLLKEVIKILKQEGDYIPLISALLIIVVLMPVIPSHFGDFLKDIFEIFSRLASWQYLPVKTMEEQLLHLQMSFYALFLRLYGMYPCNFIAYLRSQYKDKDRPIFYHTIKPMLQTVKFHPSIITSSRDTETSTERWKTMSVHDVIVECESFALDPSEKCLHEVRLSAGIRVKSGTTNLGIADTPLPLDFLKSPDPTSQNSREFFSASSIISTDSPGRPNKTPTILHQTRTTFSSPPQTDLEVIEGHSSHSQGSSPPETAVEATPETTPVRLQADQRSSGVTPNSTGAIPKQRPIPSSPLRIIQSDVGASSRNSPRCLEDEEILSITSGGDESRQKTSRQYDSVSQDASGDYPESIYDDPEHGSPCSAGGLHMPNLTDCARKVQRLRYHSHCNPDLEDNSSESSSGHYTSFENNTVRRASSCPEMKKSQTIPFKDNINRPLKESDEETSEPAVVNTESEKRMYRTSETQTENFWPMPYEHLFLGMFPRLEAQEVDKTEEGSPSVNTVEERYSYPSSYELLEKYIQTAVYGEQNNVSRDKINLQLMYQQLLFERYRRETHACRNRRLFPEIRNNRYLEEHNLALMDQIQLQQAEIDNLKIQLEILKGEKRATDNRYNKIINYLENQQKSLQTEIESLKDFITKLESQLLDSRNKCSDEIAERKKTEETLRDLLSEVTVLREQVKIAERCKVQVAKLNRDLVMAGELVVKYEEKLLELRNRPTFEHDLQHVRQSYHNHLRVLAPQLEQNSATLEAARGRVFDLEQKILCSEDNSNSMKRHLREANNYNSDLIKAVNDKYQTQIRITQILEEKLLELYAIIDKHELRSPDLSSCQEVELSSLSASIISSEQSSRQPDVLENLQDIIDQAAYRESGRLQTELSEEELPLPVPGPSRTVTFQDPPQATIHEQPGPSFVQKFKSGKLKSIPKVESPQKTRETGKTSK